MNVQVSRCLRSALLAPATLAALVAAAAAQAQGSDCASVEAQLAARAAPVCAPLSALSPAQKVACGEHARLAGIAADCHLAAERDDRRRLDRFPTEVTHRTAERGELEMVVVKLRAPNARLVELLSQLKVLAEKAEFYRKGLPLDLQREVDANAASLLAVRDVFSGLQVEIAGIVDKYADERAHLRKLWAGARPGSLGVFVPRAVARAS